VIYADAGREHVNEGSIVGMGAGNEVMLNIYASDDDDAYTGQVIFFRSGDGQDQSARITAYDGVTHVATLWEDLSVPVSSGTGYVMLPGALLKTDLMAQGLLANGMAPAGEYDTVLSGIASDVTTIHSKLPAGDIASAGEYDADMTIIKDNLERVLGLTQENYYVDNTSYIEYNGAKLMTAGRMRIYSTASGVGTDSDVLAPYNVATAWTDDEMTTYKVNKV